jgi:hypothetical protein
MAVSGFTIVRNATLLDFPLEASLASVLPAVDEMVVNVGVSDDDTLARVRAIGDARIRVVESRWNPERGTAMLADETQRAMAACRFPWGIYIQADEVLGDGSAAELRRTIERCDGDRRVEGVLVEYRHFYGGFDAVATNRKWYARETRALRLDIDARSYRDAQGFRVGPEQRRIRCVPSRAVMYHYGWARPAWALSAKRSEDATFDAARRAQDPARPLLPWIPGIRPFAGEHPAAARAWIAERRTAAPLIAPLRLQWHHLRLMASGWIEQSTGWRPFAYRNYARI